VLSHASFLLVSFTRPAPQMFDKSCYLDTASTYLHQRSLRQSFTQIGASRIE